MTMPKRAEIRSVLLELLRNWDGTPRRPDVIAEVTDYFTPPLTAEDLAEKLRNGRTSHWENRGDWARDDLARSGHIDNTETGIWALTEKGIQDTNSK